MSWLQPSVNVDFEGFLFQSRGEVGDESVDALFGHCLRAVHAGDGERLHVAEGDAEGEGEASLVMPLFVFAIVSLIQMMILMNVQLKMQSALYHQTMKAAGYSFLAVIILAVCIALPVTIYKKSRPVALSYCIVNSPEPSAVDTSFVDEYLDFYNLNGAYQIHNDLTVHLDKDTYLEEYSQNSSASVYTELPMLCFNGYYDIMIMDEKGLEYCAMQEIIYPLKTYLPADIYSQISDRICTADDNDGVPVFAPTSIPDILQLVAVP